MKESLQKISISVSILLLLQLFGSDIHAQQLKALPVKVSGVSTINFTELAAGHFHPGPFVQKNNVAGENINSNEELSTGNAPVTYFPFSQVISSPLAVSPAPILNYVGLQDSVAVGTGTSFIPPNTNAAVGLTKVMVTLSNNICIKTKSTGAVLSTVSLESFWTSTGASGVFYPKIDYDPYNDRWIFIAMSNIATSNSSLLIAVSQTSDPSGSWTLGRVVLGTASTYAEFPSLGFNKNWVAVGCNIFNTVAGTFNSGSIVVFNYPLLRSGTVSSSVISGITSGNGGFCIHPAYTYSSTQDTLFVVSHLSSGGGTYKVSRLTGTPASATLTIGTTRVNSLGGWAQPGGDVLPQSPEPLPGTGTAKINIVDASIRSKVVYRRDFIYYSQTVGLPVGGMTRSAVQWVKVKTDGTFSDGGRVDDPTATATNGGKWYAFSSVDVNMFGDMIVGYSQFSSAQFAAAGYSIKARTDAAGTIQDPYIYRTGVNYYQKTFGLGRNRWGDYSAGQTDPSDNYSLWTIQEFADTLLGTGDGSGRWNTWMAKVQSTDAAGDIYRSANSSSWNTNATWQVSHGDNNWSAASGSPTSANSFGINIRNTNSVSLTASTSADEVIIDPGGTLVVNAGQTLTIDDGPETDLQNNGTLQVDGSLVNNGKFVNNGIVKGTGTLTVANFSNPATVAPGDSPGSLTISGNYAQTSAGTLEIELGGVTAGTQYDVLNISGTASLNGTLNVTFTNSFVPVSSIDFIILDAASLSGTFSTVNLPDISPNTWSVFYDNIAGTVTLSALFPSPLDLLSFNARPINADVLLNWNTENEINHRSFDVERSLDGIHFNTIGNEVALTGSGVKHYQFTDNNALQLFAGNGKIFYRLKMISTTGGFKYSPVITVNTKDGKHGFVLSTQPNPFKDAVNISLSLPSTDKVSIILNDVSGRLIYKKEQIIEKGYSTLTIDKLGQLPAGIYTMQLQYKEETVIQKIVK